MTEGPKKINDALGKVLKRLHYPIEVMLVYVRWYAAYPLSAPPNAIELVGVMRHDLMSATSSRLRSLKPSLEPSV